MIYIDISYIISGGFFNVNIICSFGLIILDIPTKCWTQSNEQPTSMWHRDKYSNCNIPIVIIILSNYKEIIRDYLYPSIGDTSIGETREDQSTRSD